MTSKILGGLIIATAVCLMTAIFKDELWSEKTKQKDPSCIQLTPSQQLIKLISDDFRNLGKSKQLPIEWTDIETIELKLDSELAKTIMGKARPSFARVKNGKFHLELEIMDLPDHENPGIIIQASLFDKKTKNKIFEIGRTYTMNDLNKIPIQSSPEQATNSKINESKSNKSKIYHKIGH